MKQDYDFIELYNMMGVRFYGGFSNLEAAKPCLNELKEKGELLAIDHSLLLYAYRYNKDRSFTRTGIYVIHYKNGWRIKNEYRRKRKINLQDR